LLLGKQPMADLDRVHDRPVVNVIGAVQIHNLLDRTRIDARQPADTCEQVSVGSRVIHGPLTGPRAVGSQAKARMVRITKDIGIPKTRPDPFVLLILPIGGKREILVLDCRVFFKGNNPKTASCFLPVLGSVITWYDVTITLPVAPPGTASRNRSEPQIKVSHHVSNALLNRSNARSSAPLAVRCDQFVHACHELWLRAPDVNSRFTDAGLFRNSSVRKSILHHQPCSEFTRLRPLPGSFSDRHGAKVFLNVTIPVVKVK